MDAPVTPPSPDNLPRPAGHETTDANPAAVGLFAFAVALMIALVMPFLSWLFRQFEVEAARRDPPRSPVATDQTPPEPRLQAQPAADLAALRAAYDEKLTTYGWVDQRNRVVRVPISRAIDILAERGLPEPKGPLIMPPTRELVP